MSFTCTSALNITLLILLVATIVVACLTLPVDKILKDLLVWIDSNLGPWGPLALIAVYIPLTILAVPASVLTLGGGYLFGLPIGFIADSIGSTVGAVAAFLVGRTIGKSLVVSRLKDYPQFKLVTIAIQKSGFKISILLRLAPFVPFSLLNYFLSVTPVPLGEYTLTSWLGMMVSSLSLINYMLEGLPLAMKFYSHALRIGKSFMDTLILSTPISQPLTLALVYVGTTLKDLSDVTRGWGEFSKTHLPWIISGLVISVVLMIWVTKVAKSALDKALAECVDTDDNASSPELPIANEPSVDLNQPLINKTDQNEENNEIKFHYMLGEPIFFTTLTRTTPFDISIIGTPLSGMAKK